MKKDRNSSADAVELRRRAEERLQAGKMKGTPARIEADTQRLVHELQVHQIELEMQNEELRQSRAEAEAGLERYTELYDFAPVGYFTLSRDGTISKVNLTGARLLGVERARMSGRRFGVFVGAPDRVGFKAFLEKVFASQEKEVCEVVLLKEGQGLLNVHIVSKVSLDGQECCLMMVDITERKQAEDALRDSERFLRFTLDGLSANIALLDEQGKILLVNKAWREFAENNGILSVSAVLEGSNYLRICDSAYGESSEEAEPFAEGIRDVLSGVKKSYVLEYPCHSPDKKRWFVGRITPFPGDGPRRVVVAHEDITERKQAEEALRESEEIFNAFMEHCPVYVFFKDEYMRPIRLSRNYEQMLGRSIEELLGKTMDELFPSDLAKKMVEDDLSVMRGGKPVKVVEEFNGRIFETTKFPVIQPGKSSFLAGFTIDITERQQAESELKESQRLMDFIIRHDPNATAVFDDNLRYIFTSERFLDDYKVKDRNIIGKHHYEVFPEMPERWKQVHQRVLAGAVERCEEDRFERLDGSVDYNRWECRPWYRLDGSIGGMITYTEVITERKRAEVALRKSEAIFNSFMEHCPVYVFFKDENTRSIRLSRNYEQLIGKPIEALLGKTVDELFPSEMAKKMVEDDLSVIRDGKPIKVVEELDGKIYETTKFPIFQHGMPNLLAGFTIDITDRNLADKERIKFESQLRQAQKMEAIGTLAGGIAHDFNNILSVIIGNAEILKMSDIYLSGKNELEQVLSASKRAKQLVRQILAFSRQGEQQKLLMSLKPVVKETIEFLRASIPSTIQLQSNIKHDAGTIMADPTQMQQVLMNLSTNAAHAMEKNGGVLTIELDAISVAEEDASADPEVERGLYVRLVVSDTGHGIDPAMVPRIFDPYFTTKGPDKGTGLGLSVVHGIVKSHGGTIKVYSELGKGTAFHVLFPRADEQPKVEEKPEPSQHLPFGTEKILVVDDEKHIVEMYKRMLGLLGYRVDIRTSPVEAIEALRSNPMKYDLILTDMTMPQMNGYNFAKNITMIRPDLPVILCTGFSDQINDEKARSVGIHAFLLKPVLFNDLANALRRVLDERQQRELH